MDMTPALKRSVHWLGICLSVAATTFVLMRLRNYYQTFSLSDYDSFFWIAIIGLALVYGIANILLGLAWWALLRQLGISTTHRWAIKTYGLTQLAKYVPGNIFHLAGRQIIGIAEGLPGLPLAKSAIWELVFLILAGALTGSLAIPCLLYEFSTKASIIAFTCAVCVLVFGISRSLGAWFARAFILHCVFLVVSGLVFAGIISLLVNNPRFLLWPELWGAFILAWLAGLVTPGAPAGAGIREWVLILLLNKMIGENILLLAIVLGRLTTVIGDMAFFSYAFVLKKQTAFPESSGTD